MQWVRYWKVQDWLSATALLCIFLFPFRNGIYLVSLIVVGILAFTHSRVNDDFPGLSSYLRFAALILANSFIGAVANDFSPARFLLAVGSYLLPPIVAFLFIRSRVIWPNLRALFLIVTCTQFFAFGYQVTGEYLSHTFAWGSDFAVGTTARAGVSTHTAGVIMSLLGMYWLSHYVEHPSKTTAGLSFGCLVAAFLTASTHVLVCLYACLLIYVAFNVRWRTRLWFVGLSAMAIYLMMNYQREVFWNIRNAVYMIKFTLIGNFDYVMDHRFDKLLALQQGIRILVESPVNLLVGVGLGNFNDRVSAMALFPDYAPRIQSIFQLEPSQIALSTIGPDWNMHSVTNKIFSDLITLVVSLGLLGIMFVAAAALKWLRSYEQPRGRLWFLVFVSFVILLGCFDNWLQYPQVSALWVILCIDLRRRFKHSHV